jgi:3-oxoacyl-[acyl-carrier protein] reductase
MDLGLEGQAALVTGGSRGIGRAIVEALRAEGVRVATGSRHPEDFRDLLPAPDLFFGALDVTDPSSIQQFVEAAVRALGPIDMLVNNAGKAYPGTFHTLSDEDWGQDIDVKLLAQVRVSRAVLPHMPDGGRILNLTAIFGKQPDARFFASSVNRAACSAFTKALAQELAPRRIRVNALSIGLVHSGQWDGRPASFFEEMVQRYQVPLGRFGEAREAAAAAAFLLSAQASYLTGVILDVDGGMARYL